jgi:hypothetical protein
MAGTKIKTTITTVVALLLLGGAVLVTAKIIHAGPSASAPDIQGTWEGLVYMDSDLYLNGLGTDGGETTKSHLVLKFFKTNGVYRATADWIELGKKDVPLGKVVYNYPNLEIQETELETWKLKLFATTKQMVWNHHFNFVQSAPALFTPTTNPPLVSEPLKESDFAPRPDSALQGYWKGKINTGSKLLSVDFKIAQQADRTFRAESDDPNAGVQGRPIIVSYRPPAVEFELADGAGKFQGQINGSNTVISGNWIKGGRSITEIIQRSDYRAEHEHDAEKDYSFISGNDLQGHWKGVWIMPFGKAKLPIRYALDIAKLADGSYSATLASLDQFGADAPIPTSDFLYERPKLHMEWKLKGGAYDGRLINGKIQGNWMQSGAGFPLVFERSLEP